jgi:hypothetical protein
MMMLKRMALAAAVILGATGSLFAQGGTIGSTSNQSVGNTGNSAFGNTSVAGSTSTTSGLPGTTSLGSTSLPGASSSVAGNQANNTQQFSLAQTLVAPSKMNINNQALATSNFLRGYYGAVYYQGSTPNNVPNGLPGSFGTALYPATATSSGGRGQQGNTRGAAGASGSVNTADPGGQIVALPRQIAYASQVQFKMPANAVIPPLQNEVRSAISRIPTSMVANPAAVQVDVDGRTVTLRGQVRDDEELHLLEGLVRLTPGVGTIKNELTIQK